MITRFAKDVEIYLMTEACGGFSSSILHHVTLNYQKCVTCFIVKISVDYQIYGGSKFYKKKTYCIKKEK